MKELVWHRQLLPAADRYAAQSFLTETGTGTTTSYGEHASRVLRLAKRCARSWGSSRATASR